MALQALDILWKNAKSVQIQASRAKKGASPLRNGPPEQKMYYVWPAGFSERPVRPWIWLELLPISEMPPPPPGRETLRADKNLHTCVACPYPHLRIAYSIRVVLYTVFYNSRQLKFKYLSQLNYNALG